MSGERKGGEKEEEKKQEVVRERWEEERKERRREEEERKVRFLHACSEHVVNMILSYSQLVYLSSVIGCGGSHRAGEYRMRGSVDRSIASHSGS